MQIADGLRQEIREWMTWSDHKDADQSQQTLMCRTRHASVTRGYILPS